LRIGVSARLAKTALAEFGGVGVDEVEEVWHGLRAPYEPLFAWLTGAAPKPETGDRPVFLPLMLANPLDEADLAALDPAAYFAEWKWDGIRVQLSCRGGERRIYSRTGDEVSGAFPDLAAVLPDAAILDGELLTGEFDAVGPFNDLQQRLNRKLVTAKMLQQYPAFVRLYDALWLEGEDLRPLPLRERRQKLEEWYRRAPRPRLDLSPVLPFASWEELGELRGGARERGIEGLMLKRADAAYLAGRPKGPWFKWKRGALTLDCVVMYAQRGHGKRSSFYSDYTFGAWRGDELVPVGKAYSGFTDEELLQLDRWIRHHTTKRFGPVREVEPGLVLEVAFDSVHRSTRHKSGLAMRFPRVHRIRWDKPPAEADRVETLAALVVE
jgi:DNA ligase-1